MAETGGGRDCRKWTEFMFYSGSPYQSKSQPWERGSHYLQRKQVRKCRDKTILPYLGYPQSPPPYWWSMFISARGLRRIYSCAILGWGGMGGGGSGGRLMDIFGWCQQLNTVVTQDSPGPGPFSTLTFDKFMAHAVNITLRTSNTKQFFYIFFL